MWTLLWTNRKILIEVIGVILVLVVGWWFFIHNPKVIDGLEKDKQELARQVEAGKDALLLLDKIQKGKVKIDEGIALDISAIRNSTIPRRTVLIRGGLLQTMYSTSTTK